MSTTKTLAFIDILTENDTEMSGRPLNGSPPICLVRPTRHFIRLDAPRSRPLREWNTNNVLTRCVVL